jgi:hypothetical protein
MCPDPTEQAVQSHDHEDESGKGGQFAYNAESENEFRSRYLAGGSSGISGYDETGRNISVELQSHGKRLWYAARTLRLSNLNPVANWR